MLMKFSFLFYFNLKKCLVINIYYYIFILGILYTKEKLDFESIETIDINLIAYDTGHPQLSTTATIFIKVVNINDNTPVFNQV